MTPAQNVRFEELIEQKAKLTSVEEWLRGKRLTRREAVDMKRYLRRIALHLDVVTKRPGPARESWNEPLPFPPT